MVTPQIIQCHTGLTHHVLIFDIRALWRSGLRARAPEYQKLKHGGLDQCGTERFGRLILLQSEKCGTERVNPQMSLGAILYIFCCYYYYFGSNHRRFFIFLLDLTVNCGNAKRRRRKTTGSEMAAKPSYTF